MKDVTINFNASDICGAVTSSITVSSNEPVNGTGDGDTAPDWVIVDNHHLQLRAERSGSGTGRIYTITITSKDAAGNTSTQKTKVVVPHNASGANNRELYTEAFESDLLLCKIIPNSSTQYFNLQINSGSKAKIAVKLLDISGRLISTMTGEKNQSIRFGANLKPGLYMVEVIQGNQRRVYKVVKQ